MIVKEANHFCLLDIDHLIGDLVGPFFKGKTNLAKLKF